MGDTITPMMTAFGTSPLYHTLAQAIREGGVPVFRSADAAVSALGRYMYYRCERST
jgi:hypothetical protein